MLKAVITIILSSIFLTACMPRASEKTPCYKDGYGCEEKVKINQW